VIDLFQAIVDTGLAPSKAEARRLVQQGGVELNGERVAPERARELPVEDGAIIRVGSHRFLQIAEP
jgi:tyrosyl-tRNA synthetase